MEKKYVNIEKMSDSEFLSWLYLERDREESIHNNPGWTNWALVAALISIICFMYSILLDNRNNINLYKSIVCSSLFIALFINFIPILSLFKVKRAIDIKRIRELKDEAPILYPLYVIFVSTIYFIIIIFNESSIFNAIHCFPWIILASIYLIGLFNVVINRHKIAPALDRVNLFTSSRNNLVFNFFVINVADTALFFSYRILPNFYSKDFVLGVTMASFIVLLYLLLKFNFGGEEKIYADELIDKVVYKKYTRDNAYRTIQTIRLGYLPVDYLWSEIERLNEMYKNCQELNCLIRQDIDEISKQKDYSSKLIEKTQKRLDDTCSSCRTYNDFYKHLTNKLHKMTENKYVCTDIEFHELVMSIEEYMPDNSAFIESCGNLQKEFKKYIERYICNKYGTTCSKEDCEERHQTMPFKSKMIRKIVTFYHYKILRNRLK
jgi:hypothetical protein